MHPNRRSISDELRYIWQSNGLLARIVLLNVGVFVVMAVLRVLFFLSGEGEAYHFLLKHLALPADPWTFVTQPWSLVSYFFLHEGLFHILINMLIFYWFARLFVEFVGDRHLRNLYILGGLVAGVFFMLIYNMVPYYEEMTSQTILLGASGAVYAVVVGAATLLPNYSLYLIFIGPVRIKYIAWAYVFVSFIGIVGSNSGGAIAHLGGALMGYLYIVYKQKGTNLGAPIDAIFALFEKEKPPTQKTSTRQRPSTKPRETRSHQEEIDKILDKISESGYDSLSRAEKEKLFRASNKK